MYKWKFYVSDTFLHISSLFSRKNTTYSLRAGSGLGFMREMGLSRIKPKPEPARRLHLIRQKHSVFSKSERSFDGPKALIWIDHPTDLASMNNSLHDV